VHHAEGGGGGLAERGMWHNGGKAPAPSAHESYGGRQRSGNAKGKGVGERRLAGGLARRVGPKRRERRRERGGEADGWDQLRVGPAGRERRERALTGGPAGFK
jgi:hypothetical protein